MYVMSDCLSVWEWSSLIRVIDLHNVMCLSVCVFVCVRSWFVKWYPIKAGWTPLLITAAEGHLKVVEYSYADGAQSKSEWFK